MKTEQVLRDGSSFLSSFGNPIQHGMHLVEVPTILFMPHCDMHLYENILKSNWTREAISNVLLIANHLHDYVDG
jgi:hypothetical protein